MDIVERLNEMIGKGEYYEPEFEQAKAEIERLQQTVSMLSGDRDLYIEEIKRKNTEIERLREALKFILEINLYGDGQGYLMRGVAWNALQQKESE